MFWMLLPPSANAGRHFEPKSAPLSAAWGDLLQVIWRTVLNLLAPNRR